MPSKSGYEPVDKESADLMRRNRRAKVASIVAAVALLVVFGVVYQTEKPKGMSMSQVNDADALFSAMLMDERGFYFPSTLTGTAAPQKANRRDLKTIDDLWGYVYDWKQNVGASSAVGEYYRAKGAALGDFYRTKYDLASHGSGASAAPSQYAWTYDWQADKDRGIELGEKYKAIGEAIDEHYRQVFDPTYKGGRPSSLKGRPLIGRPFSWKEDKNRGIAIGRHYKELASAIGKHYSQETLQPPGVTQHTDWPALKWKEYKEKGNEIAKWYHDKGITISNYYTGKYDHIWSDDSTSSVFDGGTDEEDVNKEAKDLVEISQGMREKGIAIGEYYRAKYDPTYQPDESAPAIVEGDFPPWGKDPEADMAHGKAIGEYFMENGRAIGHFYTERGKEIGKHYEDYYRTLFDPLYNATVDLNW